MALLVPFAIAIILAGLLGGGIEFQGIKFPQVGGFMRVVLVGAGLGLLIFGPMFFASPVPSSIPVNNPNYQPPVQNITINLPDTDGISADVKQAAANLIKAADIAEIKAVFKQDYSYLLPYYQGAALADMEDNVNQARLDGHLEIMQLDSSKTYYARMRMLANNMLAVDQCEYWKSNFYDKTTGKKVSETNWELEPQTIVIQPVGNTIAITSITYYDRAAFCTR